MLAIARGLVARPVRHARGRAHRGPGPAHRPEPHRGPGRDQPPRHERAARGADARGRPRPLAAPLRDGPGPGPVRGHTRGPCAATRPSSSASSRSEAARSRFDDRPRFVPAEPDLLGGGQDVVPGRRVDRDALAALAAAGRCARGRPAPARAPRDRRAAKPSRSRRSPRSRARSQILAGEPRRVYQERHHVVHDATQPRVGRLDGAGAGEPARPGARRGRARP